MQKVAIIGAGISGLSTAHFLQDRYVVTVYEKEATPGGLIRCRRINGNLFHTCGGHVFNSKRQDVLDWFWSKFNRETQFAKTDRNSVVFMDNSADTDSWLEVPYPIENHMFLFDSATQKHFITDLIAIAKAENSEPLNFEEFLEGRFGETLYKLYFQPYNEKIWRCDLKRVPISWLEGKLPMPTVSEMIYNNINHVKEKNFVHSTFWYEKENGSQFIANTLAEGIDVRYNSQIEDIKYCQEHRKWIIGNETYDKVVFCGNIKDMVKMINGVDISSFIDRVNRLESHGTTAVFCEIDRNPYSWIYQPSRKHQSHRIICTGNFAPSNNHTDIAPNRITATIEFTDYISKEDALENLSRIPLHPKFLDIQFNPYTYPIQDINTREMILQLKKELAASNFYFTGRFADWEYYNMDVAIGAAMDLCKSI